MVTNEYRRYYHKVEEAWKAKMEASKDYTKAKKDQASLEIVEEKRANFNRLTADYKSLADQSRQNTWDQFCEACDPSDLTVASKFWTLAKQLKSKATGGAVGPQQIIGMNGEPLRTDAEKGEAFQARFVSQLQINSELKVSKAWDVINARVQNMEEGTQETPVSLGELERCLGKIRKDSTPGPDGVKYSDVWKLDMDDKCAILELINKTMTDGKIPADWRDCNLAVLPKPNKDHTKLKCYRVITTTCGSNSAKNLRQAELLRISNCEFVYPQK
jgi:hypothetical protein